jgi:putative PIN family toxin of toxin-antitoxin system
MRFVLDTDVMIAALRSPAGASRCWLVAALQRRFTLLASVSLFLEYEATMKRPENLQAADLAIADIDRLLRAVAAVVEPVEISFLWRPQLRDPGDEMVLEAAVNGRADWLLTFNTRHLATAAQRFGSGCGRPGLILAQFPEFR